MKISWMKILFLCVEFSCIFMHDNENTFLCHYCFIAETFRTGTEKTARKDLIYLTMSRSELIVYSEQPSGDLWIIARSSTGFED